jgi:hypothetical protein
LFRLGLGAGLFDFRLDAGLIFPGLFGLCEGPRGGVHGLLLPSFWPWGIGPLRPVVGQKAAHYGDQSGDCRRD